MRAPFFLVCVLLAAVVTGIAGAAEFDDLFIDATLRIDYHHTGDATHEYVAVDELWQQGIYAGSRTRLVDDLDLGRYYAKLYDTASGQLIWSRGFNSYFGEWQTTTPAAGGVMGTYHESALAPFPKAPVEFTLESRGGDGVLREVFRAAIDPADPMIRRDPPPAGIVVVEAAKGGDPHGCVDVVILGEGYTAEQVDEFEKDVRHFAAVMLAHEPYKSLQDRFNIHGVLLPSEEPGCDEPSRGIHKRTALGCTFDSLGSERYLLSRDNRAMRDVAQAVPYDALYVMVNHERYGGGGIYNAFNTFTSDNQWSDYVFLHEFGHHFAGLADEYYSSSISYNDFYPRGVEPAQRNITRMLDGTPKWADLMGEGLEVPTEWNKPEYDEMDGAYQQKRRAINKRIAELMRGGAPEAEIAAAKAEGEELSLANARKIDAWFLENDAHGKVGAFEGAGYASEGIFRSELDCIMFTKGIKPFCAACRRGIVEIIGRYEE